MDIIIDIGVSESECFGQNTSCECYNYYLMNKFFVYLFMINEMSLIHIFV